MAYPMKVAHFKSLIFPRQPLKYGPAGLACGGLHIARPRTIMIASRTDGGGERDFHFD